MSESGAWQEWPYFQKIHIISKGVRVLCIVNRHETDRLKGDGATYQRSKVVGYR